MGVVAVIPARGGSKGIPRKNLRLVAGKPLVVHAIEVGLAAVRVDKVILSTDDEEIASVGRQAGAEVIMRPSELADDAAPTMPVLNHAMDVLAEQGWKADILVLLEPTSPFRTAAIVDECISKLDDTITASAITVTQIERNPYNIFLVDGDSAKRYIQEPNESFSRRQQFTHLKRLNGCVYVARSELVRTGKLVSEPLRVVEMSAEASINIDTPLDLQVAELLAPTVMVH